MREDLREKDVSKKWYIVNVRTSCEAVAKTAIEDRIQSMNMQDYFGDILIPQENVMELVKGEKKTRSRKFFPGYIFVNMEMSDEAWHVVKGASKVTGFVGGQKPGPVTEAEVLRITKQMEEGAEKPKPKVNFDVGEKVVIIDGPFNTFNGSVEEVNEDKGKLRVLVSIFGRPTPVELDFLQVEKA